MNPSVGLCSTCVFQRRVVSGRGSVFVMCERSRFDENFPRYPHLPVLVCPGHEEREPEDDGR